MNNESRKDKSLYTLTKKFVEMLKKEETVDLNIVTNELQCAKKRRIYDVSNVLEGIGLIKKTQKNLYKYTGKTYKDDTTTTYYDRLQKLKDEKESLDKLEKELDQDISNLKMNHEALATHKSYLYLTRQDFLNAFSKDNSILVIKDYRKINVIFEDPEGAKNPTVDIHGYVVKPVTIKLVNNENAEKILPEIYDENVNHVCSFIKIENEIVNNPTMFNSHKVMKKSDDILLFRRNFKQKTYVETDPKENEELSKNILSRNKYEGKSKFYYINDKQLVLETDYLESDFIEIVPPVDIEYQENYSQDSPSIHDLFDYKIKPLGEQAEEMVIENDEELMEEEYIIEQLDEDAYDMLQ